MKRVILAALLCSAIPGAPAQVLPEPVPVQMEEIRVSTSRIALPDRLRDMWPEEFEEVKGDYKLSNGKWMRLSTWGNRMYAHVDGMPRTQLVALSPYEFVALNETMKISVDTSLPTINNAVVLLTTERVAGLPAPDYVRLTASR